MKRHERRRRAPRASLVLIFALLTGVLPAIHSGGRAATGDFPLCVGDLKSLTIEFGGAPGDTNTIEIASQPVGAVDFAEAATGPFTDPLLVDVTFGADGIARRTLVMRGLAVGSTFVTAENLDGGGLAGLSVAVDKIKSIVVLEISGAALEPNPGPLGGDRFFPDLPTPGGSIAESRKVLLRAELEDATPNLEVFFDGWDVDDPSRGDRTLEPTTGPDNNATDASLSARSARTDATGIAEVEFDLTRQPGDNFRLDASCNLNYLFGIRPDGTNLKDADGVVIGALTPRAKASQMITVWRHLHIETDVMEPVTGNAIRGTIKGLGYIRSGGAIVGTKVTLKETTGPGGPINLRTSTDPDQFTPGRLLVSGGGDFFVTSSDGYVIRIDGIVPKSSLGATVELFDDDDIGQAAELRGDEGVTLPSVDTSLLEIVFADAYIVPVYDLGTGSAPFAVNITPDDVSTAGVDESTSAYRFDHIGLQENRDFWTVYALSAYQFVKGFDDDPESEEARLGQTDRDFKGVMVFAEAIRDLGSSSVKCQPAGVLAHELAHLFYGLPHDTTGLMQADCEGGTELAGSTLQVMRARLAP